MTNLKKKLSKTRNTFISKIDELLKSKKNKDEILEEMSEILFLADVGMSSTEKIINIIREKTKKSDSAATIKNILKEEIELILSQFSEEINLTHPHSVAMFVGVNGGGKTTSLAKLAYHFQSKGKKVLIVAADTFRAAAQEQASIWGKRLNIPVIKGQYGADPASVTYDAIQSFKARHFHLLLIDTAGRIHTNTNLMNELEKIKNIISREIKDAPHETFLVLDASIGQNSLYQAREFMKFSGISGIFLSKLDGTAKGGSAISIIDELKLPIKYIGIGEGKKDLMEFSPSKFASALLS